MLPPLSGNQAAYCPRCNAKVVSGRDWSMTRLTAMAIAMLLLMPFAFTEPLISIRLLGTRIDASLLEGIWQMSRRGDPLTASMVAFCTLGAPLTLALSLLYLRFGHALGMNLRPVLLMLERLKEWVMLDIYLIGMAVAAIKVQDYADIQPGSALIAYLSLTLLSILTLIHVNPSSCGSATIRRNSRKAHRRRCTFACPATIPATLTRAAAARAAMCRCVIASPTACRKHGRR